MAAVTAAIEEYERDNGAIYRYIRKLGSMLKDGIDQIALEHGQPFLLQGFPAAWTFSFNPKKKVINQSDGLDADLRKLGLFVDLLKKHGVLTSLRFCVSAAHTEKDIGDTLDRVNEVMKIIKEKEEAGQKEGAVHVFM
jgi:glutamate-1-semialdehyde 2,1-aminomutase